MVEVSLRTEYSVRQICEVLGFTGVISIITRSRTRLKRSPGGNRDVGSAVSDVRI